MNDQGLGSWPRRRARMSPDRAALVEQGRTTTYAEVEQRSAALAHGLRSRGVRRGDRVAYLGPNSTAFVVTLFATARLGAVFVPLNTRLAPPELAYILADAAPALLVRADACAQQADSPDVAALGRPQLLADGTGPGTLAELERAAAAVVEADDVDETVGLDDLFMIQYTSGTSGRPKGVRLTHGNVTWNVVNLLVDLDVRSDEVALVTAPMFHTAALNQVLLPTFLKGGRSLLEARWDPARAVALIESEQVTLLFGVTTMFQALFAEPSWAGADLRSLRSAISGGAPLPESLLRAALERGFMIQQGYGLTEASPGVTFLRGDDNVRKVGSAGTACFFSDVRIVDTELEDVAGGVPGEVLTQGPNVTTGYWQRPDATAETILPGGWLRTGDIARRDEDGYLYIVDRLKDMIISGGENIFPAEVENAIHTHPGVAECVVIGVPDERWGEVGCAVVVPRDGRALTGAELVAHLEGRLARYKIPRSVVVVEAGLPRTGSGKIIRAAVRSRYGGAEPTTPARTPPVPVGVPEQGDTP